MAMRPGSIMDEPWRIELLGCLRATLRDRVITRFRSRKAAALLAYLAYYRDRAHTREELIELLWPQTEPGHGRNNLSKELGALRRELDPNGMARGSVLPADRYCVQLSPSSATTDVAQFLSALEEARSAAGTELTRCLAAAVELYRGELLPGHDADWVLSERRRLDEEFVQALRQLTTLSEQAGDLVQALRWAARMVAADPLWEEGQYELVRLQAAAGHPAAALRQYHELERVLEQQLGAAPDRRTRALARQIGAEGSPGAGPESDPAVLPTAITGRPAIPVVEQRPPPTGTVTFFFTDIEGSTRLWELYPDAMRQARARHEELLRGAIEAHGGYVFNTGGDSLCSAFGDAQAPLQAALEAQEALLAELWGPMEPLRVRMALHTGAAEYRDHDYYGPPLNRIARLLHAGRGGQTLLSGTTADLVRAALPEGADLKDLGTHRLKDLQEPMQIYQLLHPDLSAEFRTLRSLEAFAHNLPRQLTSFIGRERQMAEIRGLLERSSLLTLTGPGGCGKTWLALQVGADLIEEYPDGVWLVELAALADPGLVPQTAAEMLGIREQPGRPLIETLRDHLRPRSLLLVVDNCEHLLTACARLIESLLRACPRLRIMATSREGLRVAGEQTYNVPSLSLPGWAEESASAGPALLDALARSEASRLFYERAVLRQSRFGMTEENARAVAQVCRRLDGIPLAIELAAALVKVLSVDQIAQRLDDRFRLLRYGNITALPRQQTLRALIDWSYDLLSEPERLLLRRLSVFAGGWTLEAAEAICAGGEIDEYDVLDLMARLVEKSLVLADETPGGGKRYRLLETIREYGRETLRAGDEAMDLLRRHLEWFTQLAEEAEPQIQGPAQKEWLDRLETEHDNLRAAFDGAVESGEVEVGLRLGAALGWFWDVRGYRREGRERLERVLALAAREPSLTAGSGLALVRARVLQRLGTLTAWLGDYGKAQSILEESLAIRREGGDAEGTARSLLALGDLAHFQGDPGAARAFLEECRAIGRSLGHHWLVARSLERQADVAIFQNRNEEARTLLEEGLRLQEKLGDRREISKLLSGMGRIMHERGDLEAARLLFEQSLTIHRELGNMAGIGVLLTYLGEMYCSQGDPRSAQACLEESLTTWQQVGDVAGTAWSLHHLGMAADLEGDYVTADSLHQQSLSLRQELGDRWGIAESLHDLGRVALHCGDVERAAAWIRQSLLLYREQDRKKGVAVCLESLAAAVTHSSPPAEGGARGEERSARAARLYGAAEALRETIGAPLPPANRPDRDRGIAAARATLGEAAFSAAWAEGRVMRVEQAIASALEEG
jgi:predicted ATPase/DNA-binding SARP family transcriptional activator/class 3 adenylate cyclase